MKLLFENWRRYISEENKDSDDGNIHPKIMRMIKYLKQKNAKIHIEGSCMTGQYRIFITPNVGAISAQKWWCYAPKTGEALWVITAADAEKAAGVGPLLYEVLMETIGSLCGSPIAPDRSMVTPDARGVWEVYKKRPDVQKYPIDLDVDTSGDFIKAEDENSPLIYAPPLKPDNDDGPKEIEQITPADTSDDCSVSSSFKNDWKRWKEPSDVEGKKWTQDPLSYSYYKDNTNVLAKLFDLDMVVWEADDAPPEAK